MAPKTVEQPSSTAAGSTEDKGNNIWTLLPSFDPSEDDIREYTDKVRFLEAICPAKDKGMLAPRLAMLCKGTAWGQVKAISPADLTNATTGVKSLLQALSSWEEAAELKTFEQFEKAIYKVVQKSDEATNSFVNRLEVAFHDIGEDTTLKQVKTFIMLRQSSLSPEDKKKVISMVNGDFDSKKVEQAMRSLATRILTGNSQEPKKKVYPINYVDPEAPPEPADSQQSSATMANWTMVATEEEDLDYEVVDSLAATGDSDALTVQGFERDLEEMFQEVPDLHTAMTSYVEARSKLVEKRKHRGFWPIHGKQSKGKSFGKGYRKGQSGKSNLLNRISRSNCRLCGEKGHWKAECPQAQSMAKESANVAQQLNSFNTLEEVPWSDFNNFEDAHILVEDITPPGLEAIHEDRGCTKNPIRVHRLHPPHMCFQNFTPPVTSKGFPFLDNIEKGSRSITKVATAFSIDNVRNHRSISQLQSFWRKRLTPRTPEPQRLMRSTTEVCECLSSTVNPDRANSQGLAIVDTGASRSVIGIDHVPSMLKGLPQNVQKSVRECPSKVGFRFGNNQIEYSFKQIQIPIETSTKRIWLLIEVVPKATPFLLSIQTMKFLGAVIDLGKQQCYLKNLGRSLNLYESKNGLFLVRIQDLCHNHVEPMKHSAYTQNVFDTAAAITESQARVISAPSGNSSIQHAFKGRFDATSSFRSRRNYGKPSFAADRIDESIRVDKSQPRSSTGARASNESTVDGSSGSTPSYRGTDPFDSKCTFQFQPKQSCVAAWDPKSPACGPTGFRRRVGSSGFGRNTSAPSNNCTYSGHPPSTTNSANGSRKSGSTINCGDSTFASHQWSKWNNWKPIAVDCTSAKSRDSASDCMQHPRTVGAEKGELGQKARGGQVHRHLRTRSGISSMAEGSCQDAHARNDRFHCLLRDSHQHGTASSPTQSGLNEASLCLANWEEVEWVLNSQPSKTKSFKRGIDLLEIYASPQSRLCEAIRQKGGKAERFTFEHGDLSTHEGQAELLRMIRRLQPRHIWMAPECGPWCSWSRFNANRSITGYEKIQASRELSRVHLKLCNLIMKIQVNAGRHFHMENPIHSELWNQIEVRDILDNTNDLKFDQCQFGLRHPETDQLIKKGTRVQSTSVELLHNIDQRFCKGGHIHSQIMGQCKVKGQNMALSKFTAFYPAILARTIANALLKEFGKPCSISDPVLAAEDESGNGPETSSASHPEEPPAKRSRVIPREIEEPKDVEPMNEDSKGPELPVEPPSIPYKTVNFPSIRNNPMTKVRDLLPKSGVREWNGNNTDIARSFQDMCPGFVIHQVIAGKGRDRFITGNLAYPIRQTFVMSRFNKDNIYDLGKEEWTNQTKRHRERKAIPSHVMVCIFGCPPDSAKADDPGHIEIEAIENQQGESKLPEKSESLEVPKGSSDNRPMHVPTATWTPAAVSNPGPNFLNLNSSDQAVIRKLHHNLGHPTSDKLATHLAAQGASRELVIGAKDYLCPSCIERRPPNRNSPGKIRESGEFNEKVEIDGLYWKSKNGIEVHMLHMIDEATHFHLGCRTNRDTLSYIRSFCDVWTRWAGNPKMMVFDPAGEFVSQNWKDFLQKEGITPILTVLPEHKGRVERHGGLIKETLSRMDQDKPFKDIGEIDNAIRLAFQAKNALIQHHGFSPEQAVLGKGTPLPSSVGSDNSEVSHEFAASETPGAESFRIHLNRRLAARQAFLEADNSQALRRAFLRKSRGSDIFPWECGQLCMFWDKRKSPNMIEKGRWCGPAQVVLHESRTIVWITHMNRLLRCARENLRPVSLREFESHRTFVQPNDPQRMSEIAQQLKQNLKERSGMFQFSDLTEVERNVEDPEGINGEGNSNQPENEPHRRVSDPLVLGEVSTEFQRALETPVPETPARSEISGIESNRSNEAEDYLPTPPSEQVEDIPPENEAMKVTETVYNVSIIEPGEDGVYLQGDRDTLWDEPKETAFNACSFEFTMPEQQVLKCIKKPELHSAYLTSAAKKSHSEVQYHKLTPKEQELFDVAKHKELSCWLETSTVKSILRNRIHPSRIMSSRWVLTWKMDDKVQGGQKAKARLVVRGYQDPELHQVDTDSPTLSRDARMILLQVVSSSKWRIQNFDIKTAFLRGKSDGRKLAMEPVKELRHLMRLADDEICILEGNAYGRVDAPVLFYKEFRRHLEAVGFEAHPLDNCLYLLRNKKDPTKLDGILGTHVDDGIGGGNYHYDAALKELQKQLPFGSQEFDRFKFTGLDIEQLPDFSIKVSQKDYVHRIDPIEICKVRRGQKDAPINGFELQSLRGLCGSLQYAAVHSRPDIATKVAYLQKEIPRGTVETLLEANRVLKEAKDYAEVALFVRPIPLQKITFASFGDASFASSQQLKAQQGHFIMACTEELSKNETTDFSPIVWNTKQIGRVVRSTLSAEAYAMSSSLDKLNWIRCMWGFILDKRFRWQHPEQSLPTLNRALLITDCKSLYDLMTKLATPNCQEWRTTIEVMLIREQTANSTDCRWISTAIMLADCLTKPMDSSFLRTTLQLGRFRIYDESQTLKENANKKFGATWLRSSFNKENSTGVKSTDVLDV